jgi:hypothetical protein
MDDAKRQKFEELLKDTRNEIEEIELKIEEELAEVKKRLAVLQNEKKAQLTVYGGFCQLLGVDNDLEGEEDDEDDEE